MEWTPDWVKLLPDHLYQHPRTPIIVLSVSLVFFSTPVLCIWVFLWATLGGKFMASSDNPGALVFFLWMNSTHLLSPFSLLTLIFLLSFINKAWSHLANKWAILLCTETSRRIISQRVKSWFYSFGPTSQEKSPGLSGCFLTVNLCSKINSGDSKRRGRRDRIFSSCKEGCEGEGMGVGGR